MPRSARHAAFITVLFLLQGCGSHTPPVGSPASSQQPSGVPGGGPWTLVFADEFDTPGALDPERWDYEIGHIRNQELQYYTSRSENVRAEGGALVIEARKEPYQGYGYTSASINTRRRFEFLYGRVEVRAKLPTGNGTWPAIWMLGIDIDRVGWPACGEIDIMENVGFDPFRIHGTVHTADYNHVAGTSKGSSIEVSAPWQDFHVYAIEWHPDRVEFFVDEQRYFTFRNEGTGSRAWPFDRPHYLLINLAIGGTWGGQKGVDEARFPHRYAVDYVRIYRRG